MPEEDRLARIAAVERETAELEALAWEEAEGLAYRAARAAGTPSVVFTLRLDPLELGALRRRAAVSGIKPSVLARNYIRIGLGGDPV